MKVVKITGAARTPHGKSGARRARREERVPAVVYGEGRPAEHVGLPAHEFRMAVDGGARVVDLQIGEAASERVLLTDVQFDSMGTRLLHADFRRMDPAHEITLRIPVHVEGAPKGLAEGGVLTILRDTISIRCLPKDIPEGIRIDVSHLAVGESYEAGKLPFPDGVKLAEDVHTAVVSCAIPKKVEVEAPAEGAVPAEGAAAVAGAPGAAGAAAAAPAAGDAKAPAKDAKSGGEKKK